MKIQVLGSGCPTCKTLYKNVQEAVQTLGLTTEVEYSTDIAEIVRLGAMSSPVLAIDGQIAVAGRVPSNSKLATLIAEKSSGPKGEEPPLSPGSCSCGGRC